jgi:hypothetical protein
LAAVNSSSDAPRNSQFGPETLTKLARPKDATTRGRGFGFRAKYLLYLFIMPAVWQCRLDKCCPCPVNFSNKVCPAAALRGVEEWEVDMVDLDDMVYP